MRFSGNDEKNSDKFASYIMEIRVLLRNRFPIEFEFSTKPDLIKDFKNKKSSDELRCKRRYENASDPHHDWFYSIFQRNEKVFGIKLRPINRF